MKARLGLVNPAHALHRLLAVVSVLLDDIYPVDISRLGILVKRLQVVLHLLAGHTLPIKGRLEATADALPRT